MNAPLPLARPLLVAVVLAAGVQVTASTGRADDPVDAVRIPIPAREHGYTNFESTVVDSQEAFAKFLRDSEPTGGDAWNERDRFEKALADARIDFDARALVLVRHLEGSGSVRVRFRITRSNGPKVVCEIRRREPEVGTDDLAPYAFAITVDRARVRTVEVRLAGDRTADFTADREIAKFPVVLRIPATADDTADDSADDAE